MEEKLVSPPPSWLHFHICQSALPTAVTSHLHSSLLAAPLSSPLRCTGAAGMCLFRKSPSWRKSEEEKLPVTNVWNKWTSIFDQILRQRYHIYEAVGVVIELKRHLLLPVHCCWVFHVAPRLVDDCVSSAVIAVFPLGACLWSTPLGSAADCLAFLTKRVVLCGLQPDVSSTRIQDSGLLFWWAPRQPNGRRLTSAELVMLKPIPDYWSNIPPVHPWSEPSTACWSW